LAAIVEASVAAAAGIVSSHPFVDGNKRAGLLTLRALLNLNSVNFRSAAGEIADAMVRLAAGEWSEEVFGKWVLRNSK
jgi:death-on-curing protein